MSKACEWDVLHSTINGTQNLLELPPTKVVLVWKGSQWHRSLGWTAVLDWESFGVSSRKAIIRCRSMLVHQPGLKTQATCQRQVLKHMRPEGRWPAGPPRRKSAVKARPRRFRVRTADFFLQADPVPQMVSHISVGSLTRGKAFRLRYEGIPPAVLEVDFGR